MRNTTLLAVVACLSLLAAGCSSNFGSPITATNRPLAEQIAERKALAEAEAANRAPDAVAFTDTWASGTFLRLDIGENGEGAILRSGPGITYEEIASIAPGSEVLATGNQTGEWIHVLYAAFDGWVESDRVVLGPIDDPESPVVAATEPTEPIVYEVYGDTIGVNMRDQPNVEGDLVSGAPVGSLVVGTGATDGSWLEITFHGVTGWSSGKYLRPIDSDSLTDAQRAELFGAPATGQDVAANAEDVGADDEGGEDG